MTPDPFELFGIEPDFLLDGESLAERHKELSLAAHPDRVRGERGARREALSRAIDLNHAFRALKDPLSRAEALLARVGRKSLLETKPGQAFLFEIMELREELGAAISLRNAPEVSRLLDAGRARCRTLEGRLGELFALAEGDEARFGEVGSVLSELRYIRRYVDEAAAALDEI